MAFPVLNMLSFWTTFIALVVMVSAFFVQGGAPIAGWTAYPAAQRAGRITGPGEGMGQTLWIIEHRHLLRRLADGRHQLHRYHRGSAREGDDPDAHAAHLLDLVHHRHPRRCWRSPCCWPAGRPADSRPHRRARASSSPAAW
jgi:hypothetical protein